MQYFFIGEEKSNELREQRILRVSKLKSVILSSERNKIALMVPSGYQCTAKSKQRCVILAVFSKCACEKNEIF